MQGSKYNYDELAWQKPVEPDDNEFFFAPTPCRATLHAAAVEAKQPRLNANPLANVQPVGRKKRFRLI